MSAPEPRLLSVQVWDKSNIAPVEKAIRSAGLGLNPVTDSELIRVPVPPLTKERRQELTKVVNRITEEARIAVRGARRDGNDMLKEAQKEKEISEDESKAGQKKIQELTDKYVAVVDKIGVAKEEEIMEV